MGFARPCLTPSLLINTIILQESKNSSAIKNIVTTQDELYKATLEEISDFVNERYYAYRI